MKKLIRLLLFASVISVLLLFSVAADDPPSPVTVEPDYASTVQITATQVGTGTDYSYSLTATGMPGISAGSQYMVWVVRGADSPSLSAGGMTNILYAFQAGATAGVDGVSVLSFPNIYPSRKVSASIYISGIGLTSPTKVATIYFGTQEVSGTAISWNNTDDAVYRLYSSDDDDEQIRADLYGTTSTATALATATKGEITANNDGTRYDQTFTFNVEAGTYKLAIYKPGKYVPVIREVTVGGDPLGEIKLWLYGDIDYNGRVNTTDGLRIFLYYNRDYTLIDSYTDQQDKDDALAAADVRIDSNVNTSDGLQVFLYYNRQPSSFDNIN